MKSTSKVYLSRILDSVNSVFGAAAILTSPVKMELLEPVGACDGSICQSCKKKNVSDQTLSLSDAASTPDFAPVLEK